MNPREVIIGLDGVPIQLLEELAQKDIMPGIKQLIGEGTLTKLHSSLPPNSATSWCSMITGKNPGTHGVFGFSDFIPDTYTQCFYNSYKLKSPPFWKKTNKKTLIINLPATYPAQPFNGSIITGFVSPQIEKAVYPRKYLSWLKTQNYQIDVNTSLINESKQLFLDKLYETLKKRFEALIYFLAQEYYHTIFFVVTGTDRIEHYFWDAYTNSNHPYHQGFLDFFSKVDQIIELVTNYLPDSSFMMLSDHGMGPIDTAVNLNTLLRQEGYLHNDDNLKKNFNNIKPETKAFATEQSKIYLNYKNRFPKGTVNRGQTAILEDELIDVFTKVKYKGRKVIKKVYKKREIYTGPEVPNAPNLILIPQRGFSFKTGLFKETLFEEDFLTGTHTEDDAFLYIRGRDIIQQDPWIENALSIFNQMGEKNRA